MLVSNEYYGMQLVHLRQSDCQTRSFTKLRSVHIEVASIVGGWSLVESITCIAGRSLDFDW